MALDVSALTPYTDQLTFGLAKEVLLGANTINGNLVTKEWGALGDSYQLNNLHSTVVGTNNLCSTANLGTTTFAFNTVGLDPVIFTDAICLDTLKKYWTSKEQEAAYDSQTLGNGEIRKMFTMNKIEKISIVLDTIFWQGNKSTGTGNLALCDGFLATAAALTGEVIVTRAAMTAANSIAYVDSIVAAAPDQIKNKFNIYLSPADFQTYLIALRNANYFNYNTMSEGVMSIHHPGSVGATVYSVDGLTGAPSGTFIATPLENIVLVFSGINEMSYDEWYERGQRSYISEAKTKFGTGFVFSELVVRSS